MQSSDGTASVCMSLLVYGDTSDESPFTMHMCNERSMENNAAYQTLPSDGVLAVETDGLLDEPTSSGVRSSSAANTMATSTSTSSTRAANEDSLQSSSSSSDSDNDSDSDSKRDSAWIAGPVVGVIVGIAILVLLGWGAVILRRRRRTRDAAACQVEAAPSKSSQRLSDGRSRDGEEYPTAEQGGHAELHGVSCPRELPGSSPDALPKELPGDNPRRLAEMP
jgi:hypothetical protein